MKEPRRRAKLLVRNARRDDVSAILALQDRAYPGMAPDTPAMIRGQIANFPEGQFVVEYEGEVVGWCASFIIDEDSAFAPHDWAGITGAGLPRVMSRTVTGFTGWKSPSIPRDAACVSVSGCTMRESPCVRSFP